jgi:hypothetical protein
VSINDAPRRRSFLQTRVGIHDRIGILNVRDHAKLHLTSQHTNARSPNLRFQNALILDFLRPEKGVGQFPVHRVETHLIIAAHNHQLFTVCHSNAENRSNALPNHCAQQFPAASKQPNGRLARSASRNRVDLFGIAPNRNRTSESSSSSKMSRQLHVPAQIVNLGLSIVIVVVCPMLTQTKTKTPPKKILRNCTQSPLGWKVSISLQKQNFF